jgi:hypothetical protein
MNDAIKIVEQEFESMRGKAQQPLPIDISMAIDTLEARIKDRILKELIEIPEETIQQRYKHIVGEDYPLCHFGDMEPAEWEGWIGEGHCIRVFVCDEHRHRLKGHE